jgi:two-component system, cell cycle sensor histidine kinase and response regulator CckA
VTRAPQTTTPTILVVEDNPITRKMVRVALSTEGLTVLEAPDAATARSLLRERMPALILLDLVLPDASGFDVLREIRALPGGADVPVFAFTGFMPRDEEARAAAAGFTEFLVKPVEPSRLVATIRAYLELPHTGDDRPGQGKRVLVVDDDPVQRKLTRVHLELLGFAVETADDGLAGLAAARRSPHDAILTDVLMPRMDGFKLCQALRQDPLLGEIPIVLQSSQYIDEADRALALRLGADEYVARTPDLDAASRALLAVLGRPNTPHSAATFEEPYSEYLDRVVAQLDRQAARNTDLSQHIAMQAAALVVLGSTADALAQRQDIEDLLRNTLYRCIDAAGLSVGVFYLLEKTGGFRAHTVVGYRQSEGSPVDTCFGHPELLAQILAAGVPRAIDESAVTAADRDFIAGLGRKTALFVPVLYREERLGLLLLASNSRAVDAPEWVGFAQAVAGQIGQAIALSRVFGRLRESEQRYRVLFETNPLPSWVFDHETLRILAVNNEAVQRYGYSKEEFQGMTIADLRPPEDVPALIAHIQTTPEAFHRAGTWRHRKKDGTIIAVEISGHPLTWQGRAAELVVVNDITDRLQAEQVLQERELRFRQLTENMHEVFFVQDIRFQETIYISPAYEEIWGRSCQSLRDSPQSFVDPVPLEDRPVVFANIALTQAGTPGDVEFRVVRPDGTTRWVLARTVPVRNEHGEVYRIAGVASDITERKQGEEALAQRARLAEMNAEVGAALTRGETLRDTLQRSAEALVRHLDAAFARVWVLNDQTQVLELEASAGLYTHLDGPHSRVPVGRFKIGMIAAERRPHLTNTVIGDALVHDQEWAKREGMVSFVGYPLIVEDRLVGVMAMFGRKPFSEFVQRALGSIADGIAVGIERKHAETARRAGHDLLHSVIEGATDPIFVKDAERRFVLINSAEARALGRTKDAIIGRTADEFYPADTAAALRDVDELVMRGGAPLSQEVTITGADGERTFLLTKVPQRDAAGNAIGIIGVGKDITDRKRSEEVIRHLTQAVEQSPAGVVITDTAAVIQYVNRRFTELSGYRAEEAIGKNPRIMASGKTPPDVYRELWRKVGAGEVWHGVLVNKHKDGHLWWNAATISPIRDVTGKVTHYLATQHDTTEQRLLEDQLRQAQKMEAVGRLAGGVAHDFNNMLTVITSYGTLLLEDLGPTDPRREDLNEILKAATGAAGLTRQLLAFSRQQVLEPRVLDLNEVVAASGKMLKRLIGEDVELATVLQPDLGTIRADPGQIEQVIMNLAVNARDAMPDGGRLTIETSNIELGSDYGRQHPPVTPGEYVLMSVSDTGTGMDEATQARLFEPFYTTKAQGRGTGLGLATVYGIVKQSAGFIWVYSEVGHGTTFKIYLPRVFEAVSPPPVAESTEVRGDETIVVAEDADGVRTVMENVLKRNGYAVLQAHDGTGALELVQAHPEPIHLLITDVIMPGMSGRQLADRLRHLRPELRVLFVSGYTDDAIIRHGMLEPGIAFLQKPFTPQSLTRKVREVLDGPAPALDS